MLLIDSVYINQGGGFGLLKYLVETLNSKQIPFRLIVDRRVDGRFPEVEDQIVMDSSEKCRWKFYKAFPDDVSSVFCFGNVPPPVKLNVPVYTYFHNINMLTLGGYPSFCKRLLTFIKREYIRILRNHTDRWIVQTSNTCDELLTHLEAKNNKVDIIPFYNLWPEIYSLSDNTARIDYALVGNYYNGAKGHDKLLDAWYILKSKGLNPVLHLTVSEDNETFITKVSKAKSEGLNIINHGIIPFKSVIDIYSKSKAIIYPSVNESLGLGVVEAISAGCDVIASDLPFIHAICEPSCVFDRTDAESIAKSVINYERMCPKNSRLLISDDIDKLIETII